MFDDTNLSGLTDIPAFLHLHVLMNADYNHDTAKQTVKESYGITRAETLNQWVVWILEFAHICVA